MMESGAGSVDVERDWFLQQVVVHHRAGDHYPDPRVIGDELRFTPMQTDAVLLDLRALRWIAASPYDPDRLRLTPRCWDLLRRMSVAGTRVG
jgi:hypothetical protein